MTSFQFIATVLIPSGVIGALAGGLVNYFSSKNLDIYKRSMEARKVVYTRVNELLAAFYDTASKGSVERIGDELLVCFREIQIWGSDEVVLGFQNFIWMIDSNNSQSREKRDLAYKEFVIAMRKDILGKTNISPAEMIVPGKFGTSQ